MNFPILLATAALAVAGVLSTPSPFPNYDANSFSRDNNYGSPKAPWDDGDPGWYLGDHPELYPDIPCLGDSHFCYELSQHPDGLHCPKHPPPPPPPHKTHKSHKTTSTTSSTTSTTSSTTSTTSSTTSTTPLTTSTTSSTTSTASSTTSTTPLTTSTTSSTTSTASSTTSTTSSTTSTTSSTTSTPTPTPPPGYTPTFTNITCATQADGFLTFGLVDTEAECLAMCDSVAGCNFVNDYYDVNGKGGSTQLSCSLFSLCHDQSTATNCGGQTQPSGLLDFITNSDGFCRNGVSVSDPN